MKSKSAFTLAEILITLTIVGILAAVLLPRTISNANVNGARAKFKNTFAQIQKGFRIAKEVDKVSFLEIDNMDGVNNFVRKYFGARVLSTNHALAGTDGKTYQLSNGTQLIIPESTVNIIEDENGDGCIETSTLSAKCIAYIDINASKAPNDVLGTVVTSGSDTPDDDTGACVEGTYAVNQAITTNTCIVSNNVYFDIFPVVIANNNLEPYSNAVAYILGLATEAGDTEIIQTQEQGNDNELTSEEIQAQIAELEARLTGDKLTPEEREELELELKRLQELLEQLGGGNP